jgi:hypothetical protein
MKNKSNTKSPEKKEENFSACFDPYCTIVAGKARHKMCLKKKRKRKMQDKTLN